MKIEVFTLDNKKAGDVTLGAELFSLPLRNDILHAMVNYQLAKRRSGTQKVKSRSEVHGTTKKPFNQKGTGNARQGSNKGPHMRGGGVANAFGPRDYSHKLNKKFRAKALKVALSLKASENNIAVLDTVVMKQAKTKELSNKLDKLGLTSALVVRGANDKDEFFKASRGLKFVDVIPQIGLNVYDILQHEKLVFTKHALEDLEKRLA